MEQFSLLKKDRNNSTGFSIKKNPQKAIIAHMIGCTAALKTKEAKLNRIIKELKLLEKAGEIHPKKSIKESANKIYLLIYKI